MPNIKFMVEGGFGMRGSKLSLVRRHVRESALMNMQGHRFQRRARVAFSLGLIVAALWTSPVRAQSLEVIALKYRTAEEVIPVLQPLLEPGGALTGQQYQLFVRTSPANLAQLRAALAQIDKQPQQLLVSVRKGGSEEIERERESASADVRSNGNSSASVSASDARMRTQSGGVSSVQVIEGSSAFIASGSSVPIATAVAAGGGRRPWVAGATTYRNLGSGFLVTPRVNGRQVVLDISQQDERLTNGTIQTQHLTTQVTGRLGEWIRLGGVDESSQTKRSGILTREYSTRSDEQTIWVKVEATR